MIVTVTLNPAWDVTYRVGALRPGEVHRVGDAQRRPGGKGVNVASVVGQCGGDVVATGLASPAFADAVTALGVSERLVRCLEQVRSTVVVVTDPPHDETTSLWEPGVAPADPASAARDVTAAVTSLLTADDVLVVSGSVAPGVDSALPAALAGLAHRCGARAVVDTSGPALAAAVRAPGAVVMPNSDEIAELVGPVVTPYDVAGASRDLLSRGAGAVLATRGAEGLVVTDVSGSWLVPVPRAVRGNPTGAGDAAAAAVAMALARGADLLTAACEAVALAAAAVASPVAGVVDLDLAAELRGRVAPTPLEGTR